MSQWEFEIKISGIISILVAPKDTKQKKGNKMADRPFEEAPLFSRYAKERQREHTRSRSSALVLSYPPMVSISFNRPSVQRDERVGRGISPCRKTC